MQPVAEVRCPRSNGIEIMSHGSHQKSVCLVETELVWPVKTSNAVQLHWLLVLHKGFNSLDRHAMSADHFAVALDALSVY